jgi:hypothetical protein
MWNEQEYISKIKSDTRHVKWSRSPALPATPPARPMFLRCYKCNISCNSIMCIYCEEKIEEREQYLTEYEAWLHLAELRKQNGISRHNNLWAPVWAKTEAECVAQKASEERRERRKLDLED